VGDSHNGINVGNNNRDEDAPALGDGSTEADATGSDSTISDSDLYDPKYENSFNGDEDF